MYIYIHLYLGFMYIYVYGVEGIKFLSQVVRRVHLISLLGNGSWLQCKLLPAHVFGFSLHGLGLFSGAFVYVFVCVRTHGEIALEGAEFRLY